MRESEIQIESRIEKLISLLLRYGVRLCAVLMLGGIVVGLASRRFAFSSHFLELLRQGQKVESPPDGIVTVGVILLIALPFLRVGLTAALFAWERDFLYMAISLLVLLTLIFGIFVGSAA